jgi:hypothetical protein
MVGSSEYLQQEECQARHSLCPREQLPDAGLIGVLVEQRDRYREKHDSAQEHHVYQNKEAVRTPQIIDNFR